MDHRSSGCLSAEKFPTSASAPQGRGSVTLLSFHPQFPRAGGVMLLRKNHRHMRMDLCDELIRLACDDRAGAQPFSRFGIFLASLSIQERTSMWRTVIARSMASCFSLAFHTQKSVLFISGGVATNTGRGAAESQSDGQRDMKKLLIAAVPLAPAQNCLPTVVGWTGSYTLTGNGTGQTGRTTVSVNEQYQGQVQLNAIASGCSPLQYLGSLPTSSGSIIDSFVNPCPSGGSATSTWVAPSQPGQNTTAILSIDLSNGTYTFAPVAPLTVTVTAQTCDGGSTTATSPSSLGSPDPLPPWPPSFTLPAKPQELKAKNFEFNAAGGPTATVVPWTLSFTLDPVYNTDDPCKAKGSSKGCENHSLGEDVPIVGTGFILHYESNRPPGAGGNIVASAPSP